MPSDRPGNHRLRAWQEGAFNGISTALVVVALIPVVVVSLTYLRVGALAPAVGIAGLYVAAATTAFVRRAPFLARTWVLLSALIALTLVNVATAGINSSVGSLLALSAALATVFIGWRAALVVLLFEVMGCAIVGFLFANSVLPLPPADLARSDLVGNWWRKTLIITVLAVIIVVATSYLLQRLAESVHRAELLVEELRTEITAREKEAAARAVAEERLWRAQKHELVGQLAAGLAHEINNTLTVVRANAELMKLDLEDPNVEPSIPALRQSVLEIESAALAACDETRRLLSLGRHDVASPTSVDLGRELASLASRLRLLLPDNIVLDVRSEARGSTIFVDRAQLRQVIMNLALNARDAMPEGGLLRIVAFRTSPPKAQPGQARPLPPEVVCLEVADQGLGIASADLERIFEPFFTSKSKEEGSGLGLSFVQNFVERCGGVLSVESLPGAGATFRIYLAPGSAESAPTSVEAGDPPGVLVEGHERVLVVDDDARIRRLIVQVLERLGYDVTVARDGKRALELLAATNRPFDLLCTDAMMPGISGKQLAERFLAKQGQGRVLVCSGYVNSQALRQHLEERKYAFLAKPFTPAELSTMVRLVLDEPIAATTS